MRVLLLSDSHLGFDLPERPRADRRRRGPDFFAAYARALEPALRGQVDAVVHGGDLLYRSRVPARLVARAFDPLKRVADRGIPVFAVPGNHERSRFPHPLLAVHPGLHVFDRPRSFAVGVAGLRVVVAGFPYHRSRVRDAFPRLVEATGWRAHESDVRLLCLHHCVEGATVGPADFTFRSGEDVIRGRDVPRAFAAVLAGHVHRRQVLRRDLGGRPLAAPVFYPGSTERTSFAERSEPKTWLELDFEPRTGSGGAGRLRGHRFRRLPTRPMRSARVDPTGLGAGALRSKLARLLGSLPAESVVRLDVRGRLTPEQRAVLSAPALRALAPPTMNVTLGGPALRAPAPTSLA